MPARKILTPEQKVGILREHLLEKVPVSQVCDKHGVSVVNFYNWQKQFFENGAAAFERKPNAANVRRQQDANVANWTAPLSLLSTGHNWGFGESGKKRSSVC